MGEYHISNGGEYIRKSRRLPQKPLIFVVCEGETEKNYFINFKSINRNLFIHVWKFDRDSKNMIKKFKNRIKYEGIKMRKQDKAWFVFDMDKNDERVKEANEILSKSHYNAALSIPSFELWILLHYKLWDIKNSSKDDIEKELEKYIKNYSHGMDVYEQIRDRTKNAINNARKLEEMKTDLSDEELYTSKANPITHVYKLVEFLEENKDR